MTIATLHRILSVLHTWTRQLVYHPHIHCIVPAGALSEDGRRWRSGKKPDFLFTHKAFHQHYRKPQRATMFSLSASLTATFPMCPIPTQATFSLFAADA
jgi:hypothetical protein